MNLTSPLARRLAITKQCLAGPRPAPGPQGRLEVARDLGCVQLDPISAVDHATGRAVAVAIDQLAAFLGATAIDYNAQRLPAAWKKELLA